MIERNMKVEWVNENYVKITGGRQTGKTAYAERLAETLSKDAYQKTINVVTFRGCFSKGYRVEENGYVLVLDEVDYSYLEEEYDFEKIKNNAIFIIEVLSTGDEATKRHDIKETVEITEKIKKLLNEVKDLEEDLEKVEKLNKKYIYERHSKLTEEILKKIMYKKAEILENLGLTK